MFFTKKSKLERKHPILYAIFVGSAVVLFWRGLWGLLDLYLFPNNYLVSSVISLVLGILILGLTHHLTKELN